LNYLGLNVQNLSSSANDSPDEKIPRRVLKKESVKHMYNKQWIEKIYEIISETVRADPTGFVKEESHVNSLATAMSAWRNSKKVKKLQKSQVSNPQEP
jgi:hypothetical protein